MNGGLRRLNLNIQGQKTAIKKREKVLRDLVDPEMNNINVIIDKYKGNHLARKKNKSILLS